MNNARSNRQPIRFADANEDPQPEVQKKNEKRQRLENALNTLKELKDMVFSLSANASNMEGGLMKVNPHPIRRLKLELPKIVTELESILK